MVNWIFLKLLNLCFFRAYQAAEPNDLWEGLQAGINEINSNIIPEPLADIMETWSSQAGYPVVTVERNGEDITLTQVSPIISDSPTRAKHVKIFPVQISLA